MRKLHLLALGSLLLAAPAAAQKNWDTEFGIQGGFSRFKLTGVPGSNSMIDVYGIPTSQIIGVFPTTNAVFAVFPLSDKLALEPGLSFMQELGFPGGGPVPNMATISLRADYAVTRQFYGALGLFSRYVSGLSGTLPNDNPHFQFGLEAAAGFRMHLSPRLNGRVEIQAITVKKQDVAPPFNVYSLLFGLSTPLTEQPAAGNRRGTAPAQHGAWTPQLGVAAGYSSVHVVGGPDLAVFSFPSAGASSYEGLVIAPSAPTIFGIFPLNDRLAAEVGLDAQNLRTGNGTIASFQLAPRADLAFGNRWYGALGPQFHFLKNTSNGKAIVGVSGVSVAWGYRFHLSGALNGRIEANYGMNAKRRTGFALGGGPIPPTTAFGVNLGMMMPLK